MSTPFKYVVAAIALLVGVAGLTLLHLENRRLQRRLISDLALAADGARLREDNARLGELLAAHRNSADSARMLVQRDIERIRAEIAVLERKAEQQHAAHLTATMRDTAAIDVNRDPRRGPTRLEYFQDRGQSTPSAAFETLVWASLKGDDATLAKVTAINSATRAMADAFIASLPEDGRGKWTPEKLGQLWFTGLFTEMPWLEILDENPVSADEVIVRLRAPARGGDEKLAVRMTPVGWKVLVPGAAFDHLTARRPRR